MSYLPSQPDATLMDCFQRQPATSGALHEFAEHLMRGPSPLSALQRERIAAYVSHLNGCKFCQDSHNDVVKRLGGSPEPQEPAADDPMAPILALAARLNRDPASVEQGDVDAVLVAGWDEAAVEHTVLVCGFFNLMNRWVEGLGIESDPKTVALGGRMLHEKGYCGIAEMVDASASRRAESR